jgi:hypothetical protein
MWEGRGGHVFAHAKGRGGKDMEGGGDSTKCVNERGECDVGG